MFVAFPQRIIPGWLLILCAALTALFLPPLQAQTADQAAQRTAVEGFLRAFECRDKAAAFYWLTSEAETNEQLWDYLTAWLDADAGTRLTLSRFRILRGDDTTARGRILMAWSSPGPSQMPIEGRSTLDLIFVREVGTWKLRAFQLAERHLYQQFMAAKAAGERRELLDRDADLVAGWLPLGLRNEANRLADQGKPEEAEQLNKLAFEVAEWMKSDFERGWCHYYEGYIRQSKREWNSALEGYEKARQLFEKIDEKDGLGKLWRHCAWIYSQAGETGKSIDAYEAALKSFRANGDIHREAGTLQDLGVAQQYGGLPVEALASHQAALELQRKLGDRKLQGILLGNIGGVQTALQQYAEALRSFEAARQIFREINDYSAEGPILTTLGNLYQILGRSAESEQAKRAALKLAREQNREADELIALHNLTVFLLEQGHIDEAGDSGYQAVLLAGKLKDDRIMSQLWSNLGEIGIHLKAWKQARESFEEMLLAARANRHRAMEALAIMSLGVVESRERKSANYHETAANRYREAAEIATNSGATNVLQLIRGHQGTLYAEMRDYGQAAVHLRQALDIVEQIRTQTEVASLQTSYLKQYSGYYKKLAECDLLTGRIEQAFAVSEQFKARNLVDSIRSGKARITRSMSPEQQREEASLEGRLAQLSATIEKTVLTDTLQQLTEQRDSTRTQLEAFRDRLYLQHPNLRTQRADFSPAAPAELATKLLGSSPRTALLAYFVLENQTLIFVLDRDKHGAPRLALHRSLVTWQELRKTVDEHWQGCSVAGGPYEGVAQKLFRYLIAPAAPELAGKDHIILVPDIELGDLAFSALLDSRGEPLAAKYALSYAPSATALLRMVEMNERRPTPRDQVPLLAFGNPVFPTRMPELPASAAEVAAISRLFGARAVSRTGSKALESEARALLGRARFVHFATHGTLDQAAPMFSAIVLTRDDKNDGFLQARELADMELTADLVVMSACETALGQKVRGEGIMGLTWALFAAGASSTMASQWQVADESTRDLMTAFYRALKDRKAPVSRAEALRRARLALIRGKKYAHPYYWAPFVLLGQWENRH